MAVASESMDAYHQDEKIIHGKDTTYHVEMIGGLVKEEDVGMLHR
jgi:hypothetical protein